VRSLKNTTEWKMQVFVKIAAVHNAAAIASGRAKSVSRARRDTGERAFG
jgi:glutamate synthase domain-containing protein 2